MIIQKQFNNFTIRIDTSNETMNLYDIAFALGFTKQVKGKEYLRKERIVKILQNLNIMQLSTMDNFEDIYITESQFYDLCFEARTDDAKQFRKWVTEELLPAARKAAGLEAFEAFRMLDKKKQKEAHETIKNNKPNAVKWDYVNMNKFCGTATSIVHNKGKKMMKKKEMEETDPEMLITRQKIQDDYIKAYEIQPSHTFAKSVVKMKGKKNYEI